MHLKLVLGRRPAVRNSSNPFPTTQLHFDLLLRLLRSPSVQSITFQLYFYFLIWGRWIRNWLFDLSHRDSRSYHLIFNSCDSRDEKLGGTYKYNMYILYIYNIYIIYITTPDPTLTASRCAQVKSNILLRNDLLSTDIYKRI